MPRPAFLVGVLSMWGFALFSACANTDGTAPAPASGSSGSAGLHGLDGGKGGKAGSPSGGAGGAGGADAGDAAIKGGGSGGVGGDSGNEAGNSGSDGSLGGAGGDSGNEAGNSGSDGSLGGAGGDGGGFAGADGAVGGTAGASGAPVTLVDKEDEPRSLALDGENVYWAGFWGGGVKRIAKTGGTPVVLDSPNDGVDALAVDADYLYYSSRASSNDLRKIPLAGGSTISIVTKPKSGLVGNLAVDATHIYWIYMMYTGTGPEGAVYRAPLGGGPIDTIASMQDSAYSVAIDSSRVYWARADGIYSAPKNGGAAVELLSGTGAGLTNAYIAVEGTSLYWSAPGDGTLNRMPVLGGTGQVLGYGAGMLMSFALDETTAYGADFSTAAGRVFKLPKAGGPLEDIATGQVRPMRVAVDDTSVFWTTLGILGQENTGTIMRISK